MAVSPEVPFPVLFRSTPRSPRARAVDRSWSDGRDAERNELIRIVEGVKWCVRMHLEWVVRFDYGSVVPCVRRSHGCALGRNRRGADHVAFGEARRR